MSWLRANTMHLTQFMHQCKQHMKALQKFWGTTSKSGILARMLEQRSPGFFSFFSHQTEKRILHRPNCQSYMLAFLVFAFLFPNQTGFCTCCSSSATTHDWCIGAKHADATPSRVTCSQGTQLFGGSFTISWRRSNKSFCQAKFLGACGATYTSATWSCLSHCSQR